MKAVDWDSIPSEVVRPGVTRRAFGSRDVLLVMNDCEPGMELKPHSHPFDQIALIVSGRAIYHVGEVGNEMSAGSVVFVPAGVEHYIEPLGDEVVKNLDVFAPARKDYMHLLEWMQGADVSTEKGE